jgi:hypothetical protein
LTTLIEANSKALRSLSETTKLHEEVTNININECDTELMCIKNDLANFNQVNKDFLGLVKNKMAHFDESIQNVESDVDLKIKEFRSEKKNNDWSLKNDIESRMDKFENSVEATNSKVA